MSIGKVIISRTDSIGDVILTLPVAGAIKKQLPGSKVLFLGRSYTRSIVESSEYVDEFLNWDELQNLSKKERAKAIKRHRADVFIHAFPQPDIAFTAEKAKVPLRIGTARRWYNLFTCNHLINYSRRKSDLHEAQLNLRLLEGMDLRFNYQKEEIPALYGMNKFEALSAEGEQLLDKDRFNLILHPKSKGSAKEWSMENYHALIDLLPPEEYKIFISGTAEEGALLKDQIKKRERITDLTGKFDLKQFTRFVNAADGLIAASTGPLHIASATGKVAIGLFSPMRPIHPGRWAPLGKKAKALVFDPECPECAKGNSCNCIDKISPEKVKETLVSLRS